MAPERVKMTSMHTQPPGPNDGFEEAKRVPRRKDTKHFCKGNKKHPHALDIRYDPKIPGLTPHMCRTPSWTDRYICYHEEYCTNCGKVLKYSLGTECPEYPHRRN